jgi:hypothetical protein
MDSDFFEGLIKHINIRYSEKEIIELGAKLNWKGNGSEGDPIIISSSEGIPKKFAIISSTLYIKIVNCTLDYIIISECKNITLEMCSFQTLGLIRSLYNLANNCTISKLRIAFSYNNFKECSISKVLNIGSEENLFENCTLTDKAQKSLGKDFLDATDFMKILRFAIIVGGIATIILVFFYFLNKIPLEINMVLSILIIIGFILVYLLLNKLQKKTKELS